MARLNNRRTSIHGLGAFFLGFHPPSEAALRGDRINIANDVRVFLRTLSRHAANILRQAKALPADRLGMCRRDPLFAYVAMHFGRDKLRCKPTQVPIILSFLCYAVSLDKMMEPHLNALATSGKDMRALLRRATDASVRNRRARAHAVRQLYVSSAKEMLDRGVRYDRVVAYLARNPPLKVTRRYGARHIRTILTGGGIRHR